LGFSAASINSKDVKDNGANFVDSVTLVDTATALASNYKFTAAKSDNNTVAITPRPATISATPTQLTFTGTTLNQAAPTTSNLIDDDNLRVIGVASGQAEGTYSSALDVVGDDKGNYTFTFTNANLVITANTTPIPPGPVTPPTPPSPNNNTVVVAGGGNSFQLAGAEAVCSADTLNQCECETAANSEGIQICYASSKAP
jgi:hypothetical protein